MPELLHAWALAPAAVGTCALAADHRRVRAPELLASLLMLVAMLDGALAGLVAPVFWAALLLAGAMGLAAFRRRRSPAAARALSSRLVPPGPAMTVHTGIGMVTMAGLLVAMGRADATAMGHTHGLTSATLVVALVGATTAYAIGSALAAARARGWHDRTQYAAMGASTLVMGVGLIA